MPNSHLMTLIMPTDVSFAFYNQLIFCQFKILIVSECLLAVQQRAHLDLLETQMRLSIAPSRVWLVPHSMFHKHSVGGGISEVLLCTDGGSQSVIVSVGV